MQLMFAPLALFLVAAAQVPVSQAYSPLSINYPDLVDMALEAPVVAHVRIRDADRLSAREAPNLRAGYSRFVAEADVVALIRGAAVPPRVTWLVDLPNDARGRPARLPDESEWLILARAAGDRPGELRLAEPDAQIAFTPAAADRLREIVRESMGPDAPPRITGIGRAFHVPGSLAGESETQFFLLTADDRPISITVLRRPGEQPRWSVALGEMVDAAARSPQRDTLLWYRLACTLPPALPAQALAEASPQESRAITTDYALVMQSLGRCTRNRARI